MTYKLEIIPQAHKEWNKLHPTIKEQLKNKLRECLRTPRIPKEKLSGLPNCYKIKLKSAGYRLVYKVIDDKLVVMVIAVGTRENNFVYNQAYIRLT